jgi:hypothetical protein
MRISWGDGGPKGNWIGRWQDPETGDVLLCSGDTVVEMRKVIKEAVNRYFTGLKRERPDGVRLRFEKGVIIRLDEYNWPLTKGRRRHA